MGNDNDSAIFFSAPPWRAPNCEPMHALDYRTHVVAPCVLLRTFLDFGETYAWTPTEIDAYINERQDLLEKLRVAAKVALQASIDRAV